jgi:hypothetical protein
MSLIAGFFTGKYVVVRMAGLFAGLVVGVSWFVYILYMLLGHHAPPPRIFNRSGLLLSPVQQLVGRSPGW